MNRNSIVSNRGKSLIKSFGAFAPGHFRHMVRNNKSKNTTGRINNEYLKRINSLIQTEANYNQLVKDMQEKEANYNQFIIDLQDQNNELYHRNNELYHIATTNFESYSDLKNALIQSRIISSNSKNHKQIINQIKGATRPASKSFLPPITKSKV